MPNLQRFALPDVGEGLTEADIVTWHVAAGDTVAVNQVIVEIETAKSLVELPSPWDGVVAEILVTEGTTVDVGTAIIVVDTDPDGSAPSPSPEAAGQAQAPDGAASPAAAGSPQQGSPAQQPQQAPSQPEPSGGVLVGYGTGHAPTTRRPRRTGAHGTTQPASRPTAQPAPATTPATPSSHSPQARPTDTRGPLVSTPTSSGVPVLAKPPVRKLARDLGIDLETVTPSGPGGIITRDDVVARAREGEVRQLVTYPGDDTPWLADGVVSDDGRQTRVPVRSVRRRTAEAMVASAFTAPHVTVLHTVDVTRTMKLVEKLRADKEFDGVRVTPLLIAAKALVLAIRRHPEISAAWDDEAQEIVYKHYINLGIAAATPRGLVVPNIKNAHRLGLRDLAQGIADLTATARQGRTAPSDMTDGTVTITNVGVFGIDTGTPILNPGESAILAFGAITQRPWVHKGKIKPRWVTQLALSFDHRLVDGELGARVLSDVARVLEDPARAMVWS
ncbi:dihydrolipoamide acetyltransferase family protein [Serinibacter salmoneus]|uniref:Dihydrolipoamide acetyltransferase component of pyruvate dehydrogenase complex n=1 Tax=Serinibacter salmoneus TaxID=556530 RepID=A0A2A9D401_9MICO|nr:dihydrolipoamide acetyltransferase family protein [Serinibacter salmoneus]PFG21066.1 pyruvate dehydrogenase E2 component (dihydrolipoamide acetyltransferase) [Serinibacter salmoneus]